MATRRSFPIGTPAIFKFPNKTAIFGPFSGFVARFPAYTYKMCKG
jgi:hypothetical protein